MTTLLRNSVLLAMCVLCIPRQVESAGWNPDGLLFRPLKANVFEARVATLYQLGPEKLRLDIGNSIDLLAWEPLQNSEMRMGADFFTLTRLRSEGRFKFPVETTDFYFGVNTSFMHTSGQVDFGLRLRIAHISSHLSDGYAGFRESFTYSREFVDLVASVQWKMLRAYAGINYLFSTIPDVFGSIAPQIGFDMSNNEILSEHITLIGGYDLKLSTINNSTTAIHSARFGLKFGEMHGSGLVAGMAFYKGKSLHGMFFDRKDSYAALEFQVDF